jgi:hypothetical protein
MQVMRRLRVQAYLPPTIVEQIRTKAAAEDRPESREIARLLLLGLAADAKQRCSDSG